MKYKVVIGSFLFCFSIIGLQAQFNSINHMEELKSVSLYVVNKDDITKKESVKLDTVYIDKSAQDNEIPKTPILNYPLKIIKITSDFGMRFHPIDKKYKSHQGIDLRANNDTVFAIYGGDVIDSGYSVSLGNYVKISYKDYISIYGHLSQYFVKKGQKIKTGAKLGITGNTGKSTGEHLHISLKNTQGYINPRFLLDRIEY